MNDRSTIEKDGARPDVERMLGEFFQSEMPAPWPTLLLPQRVRPPRVNSSWSHTSGRLALAACIALLVAGYIALSGYFPRQPADTGTQDLHHVGQGHKKGPAPVVPNND